MKLQILINSLPIFNELLNTELDSQIAYKLKVINKKLLPYVESFQETRKEVVEKYSITDPDGNTIIPKSNIDNFNKEIQKLVDSHDVDVEIEKIPIDNFLEAVRTIKPNSLILLDWLIEDE